MPLLGTLRPHIRRRGTEAAQSQTAAEKNRGDDDENKEETGAKTMETTNPVGPSFYYKDIEFWQNKFSKHIKERDYHKRYLART